MNSVGRISALRLLIFFTILAPDGNGLRRYLSKSADFSLFVIVVGQQTQVPPQFPSRSLLSQSPVKWQLTVVSAHAEKPSQQLQQNQIEHIKTRIVRKFEYFWNTFISQAMLLCNFMYAAVDRLNTGFLFLFFVCVCPVSTTLFVKKGANAVLCCPALPMTKAVLIMWFIAPRGQPPCKISYRVDTKENDETNCTDRRITWASTPDQSPDLQINAVALDHDGLYSCEIVTPQGNFLRRHDLQVLVPPAVSLLPGENRTAVCEAIAGKPAMQIFWSPDGDHITKQESHSNGTVTVRSTYYWEQNNVSVVFCLVSHPTGNQTLSIELNQGITSTMHSLLTILYVKLFLLGIILLILGFAFFQKKNYFRK
ncbi:cell surface glycoprotein CD200 receptor 2-like [Microtus oregoni]|uniref:cell surface glycoprotein CD200 receptor 2-like n=1 Tax=Microtus oregoni TaxID=111838 RepID=UPI001BB2B95A|nr:cell surface glycoprotein CD200 receptor 2-like [Microtus oregoni]